MIAESAHSDHEAFDYISALVYDRSRIRLDGGKHELIRARLGKRMRHHGFTELPEYCHFLRTSAPTDEVTRVIDALTTNFTNFMREPDHFEYLISGVAAHFDASRPFRIWSAACSSGEEPYTMAFFLDDFQRAHPDFDFEITASDISTKVLTQARLGIYAHERANTIPREWLPRYFQKGTGRWADSLRIKPSLAAKISFQQINLAEEHSHPNSFDVIFCRNVMIYFDRHAQQEIAQRLCQHLSRNGHLIIGHSESLNGFKLPLRCVRPSIYRKQSHYDKHTHSN